MVREPTIKERIATIEEKLYNLEKILWVCIGIGLLDVGIKSVPVVSALIG